MPAGLYLSLNRSLDAGGCDILIRTPDVLVVLFRRVIGALKVVDPFSPGAQQPQSGSETLKVRAFCTGLVLV